MHLLNQIEPFPDSIKKEFRKCQNYGIRDAIGITTGLVIKVMVQMIVSTKVSNGTKLPKPGRAISSVG